MGRIGEQDLRRIFRFLRSADGGTREDPLPRRTLLALGELLNADEVEFFELRRSDRAVLGLSTSVDMVSVPGSDEALEAFGHENPLRWRRWRPADGALRLSGAMPRRQLRRLGFFDAFMRPNHLNDILKAWMWSTDSSVACVQLWRARGEFTRRDQDVLGVLQHHLAHHARAARRGASSVGKSASLTVRETEVLTWAAAGETDAGIAARLGLSEATVGKHLEHAYAALAVHSRAEAIARVMRTDPDPPTVD